MWHALIFNKLYFNESYVEPLFAGVNNMLRYDYMSNNDVYFLRVVGGHLWLCGSFWPGCYSTLVTNGLLQESVDDGSQAAVPCLQHGAEVAATGDLQLRVPHVPQHDRR